jgi:hypothetical protein
MSFDKFIKIKEIKDKNILDYPVVYHIFLLYPSQTTLATAGVAGF